MSPTSRYYHTLALLTTHNFHTLFFLSSTKSTSTTRQSIKGIMFSNFKHREREIKSREIVHTFNYTQKDNI